MAKRYNTSVKIGDVDLNSLTLDSSNRKKNASVLKAGYTAGKRRFEIATMTTFLVMELVVAYRVIQLLRASQIWMMLAMFFLAEMVTDFVSGTAHWFFDTWGRLDTPVIGPTFIRSFREHHVDPTAMCNHDFIETNADASIFSVILNTYLLTLHPLNPASQFDLCLYMFAFFGGFFAAFTNEFHKWSHQHNLPWWASLLQNTWVVLPKKHHAVHHKPPFDKYYCITTGHLNYLLDGIGFWRSSESLITWITGVKPREDDKLWTGQIYGK